MKINKLILVLLVFLLIGFSVLYLSEKKFINTRIQFGCDCVDFEKADGAFDIKEKMAFFEGKSILPLLAELPEDKERVMGVTTEDRWIEIDLSDQKLTAWQGGDKFLESPVSSGKWFPTPEGEFAIWAKYKYTKMEGGTKGTGTYYYLPNVPYTMFFHKGFGIHGTYWHNNFGERMSHGCVNVPTLVAEKLFYWTSPSLPSNRNSVTASASVAGTKVVIHQ